MNSAASSMLARYKCQTRQDYENALKEIIQEIALLGLWRSKFFEHAAFCGGTALRILYGLDRFSEDIDFSLLAPEEEFELQPYLDSIKNELDAFGFSIEISEKTKDIETAIDSAFSKANTKEHLLKIPVPEEMIGRVKKNERIKIKLELDTNPPGGFGTEAKTLLLPIPFSVRTYTPSDLFAGKVHAILARSWKSQRVKGRDYYDFVWYVSRNIPVHLSYVEQRLRQSGHWTEKSPMTHKDLTGMLVQKFNGVDIALARMDVLPFLKDPDATTIWSNEFFASVLAQLKTC